MSALTAHLAQGLTTICRCWAITRRDGRVFGFTDHDQALQFDGVTFRADSGMSAKALVQGTGLSVDNTEALGVLSDAAISEAEIEQGRFDGAQVRAWLVNWTDVSQRMLRFRGAMGEIRRGGGAFHAELRGLTDALNQPRGQVFQRGCAAVLGDGACGFDLSQPQFSAEIPAEGIENAQVYKFADLSDFEDRWLERGCLHVLSGAAMGLSGVIKHDRLSGTIRQIELWEPIRAEVALGDMLRVQAGCDKRSSTCRFKFDNYANFRGFPHIPGEDWLVSVPRQQGDNDGGSLGS